MMLPIDVKALERFLTCFCDKSRLSGKQYKYVRGLEAIKARESRVLAIELDDLIAYAKEDVLSAQSTILYMIITRVLHHRNLHVGSCTTQLAIMQYLNK
jgi:hypothetical protein